MGSTVKWQLENKLTKALRDAGISLLKAAVDTSIQHYKAQRLNRARRPIQATTVDPSKNFNAPSRSANFLTHPNAFISAYLQLYQAHNLHFALKAISLLPDSVIERINQQIDAPKAQDYPTADAFLRLIIGFNRKIRQPLSTTHMAEFRKRFSAYVVSLQSPIAWQHDHPLANLGLTYWSSSKPQAVTWRDVVINDADSGDMRLRCYRPTINQQSCEPIILYFHGGGFCIGDLDTHHEFCYHLCAKSNWQVISVDYRLAPEYPAPVALKDCLAAYAWLARHAKDFGISANNIIVAGDSAGGCLAALVAQQLSQCQDFDHLDKSAQEQSLQDDDINTQIFRQVAGLAPPIAQLSLYPVTDTKTDYPSWQLYSKGLLLNYEDILVFDSAYIQKSNLQRNDALISPMAGNNSKLCPSFLVAAEFDMLRDEAVAYANQLSDFGVKTQLRIVKGAPHGFVHLASVHRGLHRQTCAVIDEFIDFVEALPKSPS